MAVQESYFPTHLKIIQKIMRALLPGTKIYTLQRNHDEMLQKCSDLHLGNIELVDKLILEG
jgi:UDP-2,3-diacylglucosamine pyrophosphatase LpxH